MSFLAHLRLSLFGTGVEPIRRKRTLAYALVSKLLHASISAASTFSTVTFKASSMLSVMSWIAVSSCGRLTSKSDRTSTP